MLVFLYTIHKHYSDITTICQGIFFNLDAKKNVLFLVTLTIKREAERLPYG